MIPSLAFAAWLVAIVAARVDGQGIVRWRGSGSAVGSLCPIRAVTGRRCPGCGMTRACLLLSHGRAVRATKIHPAVWLWVALVVRETYRRCDAPIQRVRTCHDTPQRKQKSFGQPFGRSPLPHRTVRKIIAQ
jgi:hypothetical protein